MKVTKKVVIFMDCGDTIVDEATQVFGEDEIVLKAEPIPGAIETIKKLRDLGYMLVIVADGKAQSFKNILTYNGVYDDFSAFIYSENMRNLKPHPSMYRAAMGAVGLEKEDIPRIVMVGNNLKRDIVGANNMGIKSVHLTWSPRYLQAPECEEQIPTYSIDMPEDLIELVEKLEAELSN
ncbi:HAD family hydrolase [Acidaminobacter sp. JC074]|uniref:HAD family hydrolase n=1 Tax=Acidaminobacter sp. JC074 TaxID=2530199 RepID=UPI001F1183C5|nr:HAD family hydrolase [Acidaminobacter sp. JC074]MCH4887002.1 HAD family hydrolase [Acidaminobacter sp. JC074]